MKPTDRSRRLLYCVALALVVSTIAVLSCGVTPTPDPGPVQHRAPNAQGMQTSTVLAVPNTVNTVSSWVSSSLVRVTSATLSPAATGSDAVVLCGSNDNTVATVATNCYNYSLTSITGGPPSQANMGQTGFNLGAYAYYAVLRTSGSTTGLTLTLLGDDGNSNSSSSDAGIATTVNQGNPNDPTHAWPVELTNGTGSIISPATAGNQVNQLTEETATANVLTAVEQAPGVSAASALGVQGVSGGLPVDVSGTLTCTQGSPPWTVVGTLGALATETTLSSVNSNTQSIDVTTAAMYTQMTNGPHASASSLSIVPATGSSFTVSGAVTANIGTTGGLALDATLAAMAAQLPASVGPKTTGASLSVTTSFPTTTSFSSLPVNGTFITTGAGGFIVVIFNNGTGAGVALQLHNTNTAPPTGGAQALWWPTAGLTPAATKGQFGTPSVVLPVYCSTRCLLVASSTVDTYTAIASTAVSGTYMVVQ